MLLGLRATGLYPGLRIYLEDTVTVTGRTARGHTGCQGLSCSSDNYKHTYTQQQSLCPKLIITGCGFRYHITSIHGLGQDSSPQPGTLFPK